MNDADWLTDQFEASRAHLWSVAFRMLGSRAEAEDAVQETWLRVDRASPEGIENITGWLTTIVARLCLDRLRSRQSRPEDLVGHQLPEPEVEAGDDLDPAHRALMADSVGPALLVILDQLAPAERVAFVLHDIFAVPFDEIAVIVGRTPTAARKLASRGRRRVRNASAAPDHGRDRQREVVEAFLAASRSGDFAALLALLAPDVKFQVDASAIRTGAPAGAQGAAAVARQFAGRGQGVRLALVDGVAGWASALKGRAKLVFVFDVAGGEIVRIDMIADPERVRGFDVVMLD